jgi:hypothetical protein
MVEVRVNIAVDVPYYQTITVEVPEDLLPEDRLQDLAAYLSTVVEEQDNNDELAGSWEGEWENSTQLRIISATQEETNKLVLAETPIQVGYYEIAAELISQLRNGGKINRDWAMKLATTYKVALL